MKPSKSTVLPFMILLSVILSAGQAGVRSGTSPAATGQTSSVPEMDRLAKLLVGDWSTTETMERGELFPNGGSRHGVVSVSLVAGGTTLLYQVHSDGSAGQLDGMLVVWWDNDASVYRFFICFNNPRHPCKLRGTAHWEGDSFVNDYEEIIGGKKTSWQDSLTFTATTHTLTAAVRTHNGTMQTLITTRATRR